jgi:hypothetical protein
MQISQPGEAWRPYNENYLLSNKGRWYSKRTKRILRDRINSSGYSRAKLTNQKHVFTHIKVVELFGDKNGKRLPKDGSLIKHGLSIDHVDGNKQNNAKTNLEIVLHRENCLRRSQRLKEGERGENKCLQKANYKKLTI